MEYERQSSVASGATVEHLNVLSPASRDIWAQLLQADPHALAMQTPEWLDAICSFRGMEDASRLYQHANGRSVLLPLVRKKLLSSPVTVEWSFPQGWGMGGLLASGGVTKSDVDFVVADLSNRGTLRTILRPNPLTAQAWRDVHLSGVAWRHRSAHVLDLEGGFDRVWTKRFVRTTRTNVRKAQRSGLEIECGETSDLITALHELYKKSLDRWACRQHEPRMMKRFRLLSHATEAKLNHISRMMDNKFRIWVASKDGHPIAAILLLYGANASCSMSAMDKEIAGPTRATFLLHSLAIEEACNRGCSSYHFGDSGSASLNHYKTRFGAVPLNYAEYYFEQLPISAIDRSLRSIVKHAIRMRTLG